VLVGLNGYATTGFRNRDIRRLLHPKATNASRDEVRRLSAKTSRNLRMLRAHGLIHKVPAHASLPHLVTWTTPRRGAVRNACSQRRAVAADGCVEIRVRRDEFRT
jgi:hypothetical protein